VSALGRRFSNGQAELERRCDGVLDRAIAAAPLAPDRGWGPVFESLWTRHIRLIPGRREPGMAEQSRDRVLLEMALWREGVQSA